MLHLPDRSSDLGLLNNGSRTEALLLNRVCLLTAVQPKDFKKSSAEVKVYVDWTKHDLRITTLFLTFRVYCKKNML